ncbi:DeoR/GlpR family transcriptional regulator [Halotalea alkalilenta]|uniref:DeoR/GlpR family transcriptional regulator n=1 Tax=Halotalea alkalilenta TaxID=376489 RepID=UPI0005B849E1|nr:DeoR/GlpR family transcriptional regulator [Halotalea alkalilenta]
MQDSGSSQRLRHLRILDIIEEQGYASIEQLAQHFGVTPQTIRRDLNQLAESGSVRRVHGGAGRCESSTTNAPYHSRQAHNAEAKRRIAERVAAEIPNHCSLFINIGTSTEMVAQALLEHRGLEVITNNLNVAAILQPKEDFTVIIAGGTVRSHDGGIIGEATIDFIDQFKVDFGIIGISGIDDDGALLEFDYREVRVAQAIIHNSRKRFLVADGSKFNRRALVRQGNLSQLDALFTDVTPPAPLLALMREHGVALHVVEAQEE